MLAELVAVWENLPEDDEAARAASRQLFGSCLARLGRYAEAEVLVVDLTDDAEARVAAAAGAGTPVLGFYAHVEQDVRQAAEAAGFTRVVPRSRMAREGPALVEALL